MHSVKGEHPCGFFENESMRSISENSSSDKDIPKNKDQHKNKNVQNALKHVKKK